LLDLQGRVPKHRSKVDKACTQHLLSAKWPEIYGDTETTTEIS